MPSRPVNITVPVTSLEAFPHPQERQHRGASWHLGETPAVPSERMGESPMAWSRLPCPSPPGFQAGALSGVPRPAEQKAVPGQPLHLLAVQGAEPHSPTWNPNPGV